MRLLVWTTILASGVAGPIATAAENKTVPADLGEAHVKAVAEMLCEEPAGFGRPISDRRAWARLAETRAFGGAVRRAEGLLKQALPEQPDDLYLDFSRTGNRTRWQRVAGQRRGRIDGFALVEC